MGAPKMMMKIVAVFAFAAVAFAAVDETTFEEPPASMLVQSGASHDEFAFDWGDLKIPEPKPMPKPAPVVIKKQEEKLVPGIKKYCQFKTELPAAKKLACEHAAEWCKMWKDWGLHDLAQHDCDQMMKLHKELAVKTAVEHGKSHNLKKEFKGN